MLANARSALPTSAVDFPANVRPLRAARTLPSGDTTVVRGRASISVGAGCVAFLWIYAGLHLAHACGVDVSFARAITTIPLFAIFIVSVSVATLATAPLTYLLIGNARMRASFPRALTVSIVAFSLSIILVP
jgi:hypothetical protein